MHYYELAHIVNYQQGDKTHRDCVWVLPHVFPLNHFILIFEQPVALLNALCYLE